MLTAEPPDKPMPLRHSMLPEDCYEGMDPGIRFAVRLLHAHGIDTNESCEGGDGHAYDRPSVVFVGAANPPASSGWPVASISYVWDIRHGLPSGPACWQVVFSRPLHDLADQRPMFIRHYQHAPDLGSPGGSTS